MTDWLADDPTGRIVPPLIPYTFSQIDGKNVGTSPFAAQNIPSLYYRHWFGTDASGRDVGAGILRGLRHSIVTGLLTMLLSLSIALIVGLTAGFYGDSRFRVTRLGFWLYSFFFILWLFWCYVLITQPENKNFFFYIIGLTLFLPWFIRRLVAWAKHLNWRWGTQEFVLPIDFLLMRFLDLVQAIPSYLIILVLASIVPQGSVYSLILIMGFVSWMQHARLIRAAVLQFRGTDFVTVARGLGYSNSRVLWTHILPNVLPTLGICFTFGMANTILNESSLSFLGFGVSSEEVTWGSMVAATRAAYWAWWLVVFPSVAIFLLLRLFRKIGDDIEKNKKKQFQHKN